MVKIHEISAEVRISVVCLSQEGYSLREIADRLHIHYSSVSRILKKNAVFHSTKNLPRSGRPRVTSARTDNLIHRLVNIDPFISSAAIQRELPDPPPSRRTIRDRLSTVMHLKSRRPAKKPLLTKAQIKKRLIFCRQHRHWTVEQWSQVLWSDEASFQQFGSRLCYVRRPIHQRFNVRFTVPTVKHSPSAMVWGCFGGAGRGELWFVPPGTTMNAARYLELLKEKLLINMQRLQCTIFQQDGAPCHTAKVVKNWFAAEGVQVLSFPPNSPDLNPIENMWKVIKTRIAGMKHSSLPALQQAIQLKWTTAISEELCTRLVHSMPQRIAMVLAAKGKHCKY